MTMKQASYHHVLACYVLQRMKLELRKRGALGDPQADNRILFENILFLVGDTLRTGKNPKELGLQTTFLARGENKLETITTILDQCKEYGWLEWPPCKNGANGAANYILSSSGTALANRFETERRSEINEVVRRWICRPPTELRGEVLDVAGRASRELVAIPHYDLSDPGLRVFFENFLIRSS